ncbi:hypothetical protein RhiirA1_535596 [Rhizophagus irregularis]|uniref:Uncharacterized protein n=1 Tax=Rhizophagus irregularis TaxID=588596 RepID=A0A2I1FI80_9GLOM|nr:hypothetical protein RhiirA1_535596 [Rhizophagus irregularis]PKY34096.1 hypothetical protein RhiirB3_532706 [Rhizophagus irregularis]
MLVLAMPKLCQNLQIVSAVSAFWQVSAFQHFGSFSTNKRVSTFGTRPNEFRQATLDGTIGLQERYQKLIWENGNEIIAS